MSIETIALRIIELATVVFVALLAVSAARAADVVFRPALTFGLFHDGNVFVVDYDPSTQAETSKRGDDLAGLAVDLAVDRNTPKSQLSFSYQPSYRKYRNATDLDYLEHTALLSYTRESSERTTTEVTFDAVRTESQSIRDFNADRPSTLVPRTTLTRAQVDAGGTVGVAPRALVDWGVRGGVDAYDDVPGVTFNDDTFASARTGWRYTFSERSTLGVSLVADWIGYDLTPDVVTETLALAGTRQAGRATSLTYNVGATRSTSDGQSVTNGSLGLTVRHRVGERSDFSAGVSRGVTPGSGLSGVSLDTGAWVVYARGAGQRGLIGSVSGSYWYREELDFGGARSGGGSTPGTSTTNVSGSLGWSFGRSLSLNGAVAYVDQGTSGSNPEALDTSYVSYGLYLRWLIAGR